MQEIYQHGGRHRLRLLTIFVPLCLLGVLFVFSMFVLASWPWYYAAPTVMTLATAGVVTFSIVVFRIIDRQDRHLARQYAELEQRYATERRLRAQLHALFQASLAIAAAQDTDGTMQRLVDLAQEVVGAHYAALGVMGFEGEIDAFYTSGITREDHSKIGAPPAGHGLLGVILHQGTPLRVADLSTDSRRFGFPPGHPVMRSLLGVPIMHAGTTVGNLYLADKVGGPEFSEEDQDLLSTLASHAAVVIEHARMSERIRTLAVAAEREHMRVDLHDSVMQAIYGISLELECAQDDLEARPDEARARIAGALERLDVVMKDLRSYVLGLMREDAAASLPEALSALLAQTRAQSLLETELSVHGLDTVDVPVTASKALIDIARDAISNVVRHARAGCIWITLQAAVGCVELVITDNGLGFDMNAVRASEQQGFRRMQDLAVALGGRLTIQSQVGGGATVRALVPVATGGQEAGSV